MRIGRVLPFAAIFSSKIPAVLSWGAAGHEIIATIAQIHLHPSVFPSICHILNFTSTDPDEPPCHLAPIATWADRVRYKMRWSASLHYIGARDDHPSQTCAFPGERGWAGRPNGNVLGAVRNVTDILRRWATDGEDDEEANEALKFLVHFVGDMHMPLHLTGRDRGGNSVKVAFDNRTTNLHSLWDGLLIAKALRTVPLNYSYPIPGPYSRHIEYSLRDTIYDSYVRRLMWEGIGGKWNDEIFHWVACPRRASTKVAGESTPRIWQQVLSFWNQLTTTSAGDETDDETLCPYYWAQPIHTLNCDVVWPKELDEPPYNNDTAPHSTSHSHVSCDHGQEDESSVSPAPFPYLELDIPSYSGRISDEWIIEKLMAQAGIRLAGILNWIFLDLDGEGIRALHQKVPYLGDINGL